MSLYNRLHNVTNPNQGGAKRVLCVCSAGLLRSPTAAIVLQQEYGYNTRSAGVTQDYALIPVDRVLLAWADEVVCMEPWMATVVERMTMDYGLVMPIITLNVPDMYGYMEQGLQTAIKTKYKEAISEETL